MMIINDDSRVVNKLEASLTDDAGVIIYDHHMFIVQATGVPLPIDMALEERIFDCKGCQQKTGNTN
jgi:hypothetical protein